MARWQNPLPPTFVRQLAARRKGTGLLSTPVAMATAARSTTRPALAALRRADPATWAVAGVTLVAGVVRFTSLSGQSFWLDESYALGAIRFPSLSEMLD